MSESCIAKNLKSLMDATLHYGEPITTNALASAVGVPQSTIWRVLNGKTKDPRSDVLEKLAKFFNVQPNDLRAKELVLRKSLKPSVLPDGRQADQKAFLLSYVTKREMLLLDYFRSSNETGQAAIEVSMKAIAERFTQV